MRKRGIFNLCLVAALSVTTAGSLYSCKDYDDDIAQLQEQIINQNSTLTELINAQGDQLKQLKSDLEDLKDDLVVDRSELEKMLEDYITKEEADKNFVTFDKLTAELAIVNAKIKTIEENVAKIDVVLNTHTENIADLYKQIGVMKETYDQAIKDLEALGTKLSTSVKNLENTVNNVLGPKITELSSAVSSATSMANANAKKIAELEKILEDLTDSNVSAQIIAKVTNLEKDLAALKETAVSQKELDELYAKLTKERDNALETFKATVKQDLNQAIGDLTKDFQAADEAVKTEMLAEVNKVADRVKANEEQLVALNKALETVQDRLDKMITSINLNGAYSPVIGYFNAPIGMKSNVLAAYYGEADGHDFNFPTRSSVASSKVGNELTRQEWELLGLAREDMKNPTWVAGDALIDESDDNAGVLYMTVNPTNVDLSTTVFNLVNSEGNQSPITLAKPERSNHRLSFGYTRAGQNNGFYEVKAKISKENIADAHLRFDLNKIKEVVKDVLDREDGVDMSKLVYTLFTEFNDIADANAVEATWKSSGKEYSAYSDYGLAAISVKPLSYAFLQDYKLDQFWGMDKAYMLLDKTVGKFKEISKKVTDQFPQFDIKQPRIDTITLQELTPELLGKFKVSQTLKDTLKVGLDLPSEKNAYYDAKQEKIIIPADTIIAKDAAGNEVATVIVPGREYNVKGKEVIYNAATKTFTVYDKYYLDYTFSVDMTDAVKELYDNFGDAIGDANAMVKEIQRFFDEDIQELLNQVNGYGAQVEDILNGQIDKVKGELSGYLDKINKKLCNLVEGVNAKLQPVMFLKTSESFALVSSAKNYPSVCPSTFVLAPSSYTCELLAPAFKKFVAVTDVIDMAGNSAKGGDSKCVSVLKNSNKGDLNKVLEGKQLGIQIEGLQGGYVYEFTYSAVDYYGYIVNSKYYIYVK